MNKIKILDTNVLLHDSQAMFKFPNELVIIPICVIEELDTFKKNQDELGRNAREVTRKIDKIRKKQPMKISNYSETEAGIQLDNGGRLMIELNHIDSLEQLDKKIVDNRILATANYYHGLKHGEVTLLTKDANLRIKGDAFGVVVDDYEGDIDVKVEDRYLGYRTMEVEESVIEELMKNESVAFSNEHDLNPNEYVIFTNVQNDLTVVGRYYAEEKEVRLLRQDQPNQAYDIAPRNIEQQIALDLLLDPDIPLVTITGKAGTGKTLLAVAAGLQLTLDDSVYNRILISRPIVPMGKDIGYLPGSLDEKLAPWMQPIFDNLEYLFNQGGGHKHVNNNDRYKELIEQGMIQVEALTYIRGRSIPQQFFIIDEAQNLSKHEIKTILSRVGEGTKIILTGDPDQIDTPYLDKVNCGLSQVVEKFKSSSLAGHITLQKGERSALAEAVTEIFK